MTSKQRITRAIQNRVHGTSYLAWTIGLTHAPSERRDQHTANGEDTTYWIHWQSDSPSNAEEIESHFIHKKGMKGGPSGNLSTLETVYVYIF